MTDRDMVSKAEVLDIYAELYDEFDGAPGIIKVLNKVYDKLERLQPQKPVVSPTVGGWISVKDRLPEVGKVVLAFGTRSATTGMFQGVGTRNDLWWWKGHTIKHVSHWMPLPEPPMETEYGHD